MIRSTVGLTSRAALAIAAVLMSGAMAPAFAQVWRVPPRPKPRPLELRAFFTFGLEQTDAPKTFDAILGKETLSLIGGGGEVVLSQRWILRGQFSQFSDTGTRVFVDTDDTVFPLDIPLDITVRALEYSAAYRFVLGRARPPRFQPPRWAVYAGFGRSHYELIERSNDETARTKGAGLHLLGGVEMTPHKRIMLAGELQRTWTDEMLTSGAADALGESQLGGLRIAGRAGFRF
jgi:hypothetical protein